MNRTRDEGCVESDLYIYCDYDIIYPMKNVLETCQRLRHKISVLNRRLLKVKAENRRLRKLLDGLKSIEIED